MKRSTQCRHTHARYLRRRGETTDMVLGCYLAVLSTPNFGYSTLDTILSATCAKCDAQLSIGKGNDRGVGDEIRAARWFASVIHEWHTTGPARQVPRGARPGWDAHAGDWDPSSVRDGWLLREMYIVRADLKVEPYQPDSWPWNPSRPIAGQFGEWVKRTDAVIAAMGDDAADQFAELTGPTDQGQPLTDAECATIIAQSSDSYEPFDGGMTGYIDQGQLDRLTAMCAPVKTMPLRVVLDGGEPFDVPRAETREEYNQRTGTTRHTVPGEPFAPEDSATKEPWVDPGASTQMTDAELVETVAYSPPGSVNGGEP